MVANLFCLLCGIALTVVGILVRYHFITYKGLLGDDDDGILQNESILATVLGAVIFTVSFFGFCGSVKNSPCMISTYAFLVSVLMVLQSALAIVLFLGFDESRRYAFQRYGAEFEKGVARSMRSGSFDPNIEEIQSDLKCCGKKSYREWGDKLPKSCCLSGYGATCFPFEQGCLQLLEVSFDRSARALAWMLLLFTVIEFVAVVCACCLASGIKEEKKERPQRVL